jgi:hypothetical protein
MTTIDFNIKTLIKNELPDITLEISFIDDFTNDNYLIKTIESKQESTKHIPFLVIKNGNDLGEAILKERDFVTFFNEICLLTKDHDFKKSFHTITQNIEEEISKFLEYFDDAIIIKGFTLEGELKRMKRIAGILI